MSPANKYPGAMSANGSHGGSSLFFRAARGATTGATAKAAPRAPTARLSHHGQGGGGPMLMLHNFSAPSQSVLHPHRKSSPQAGVRKTMERTTEANVEARTMRLYPRKPGFYEPPPALSRSIRDEAKTGVHR